MIKNLRSAIVGVVLGCAGLGAAHASVIQSSAVTADSRQVSSGQPFEADRTVDELARLSCLPGLERFLPGTYYYCQGTRAVALGQKDRARQMLKLAAGWGSKPAAFLLGIGYFKGDLHPVDRARGLAWLGLSTERGDPNYLAIFASAWKQATPQEQQAAEQLWQSMLPTYGDAHAARRAASRFERQRRELLAQETAGKRTCIAGLNTGKIERLPILKGFEGLASACGGQDSSVSFVARRLDAFADQLLDGWEGRVSVGKVQPVTNPPK